MLLKYEADNKTLTSFCISVWNIVLLYGRDSGKKGDNMHFSSQEIEQPLRSLFSPKENNEGTELNGIVLYILYEMGQFYTVFAASSFFFSNFRS